MQRTRKWIEEVPRKQQPGSHCRFGAENDRKSSDLIAETAVSRSVLVRKSESHFVHTGKSPAICKSQSVAVRRKSLLVPEGHSTEARPALGV